VVSLCGGCHHPTGFQVQRALQGQQRASAGLARAALDPVNGRSRDTRERLHFGEAEFARLADGANYQPDAFDDLLISLFARRRWGCRRFEHVGQGERLQFHLVFLPG